VVGKAEGNIVAQAIVLQQEFDIFAFGGTIDVVGAAPSEDFVPTFGKNGTIAGPVRPFAELVAVSKLGIAENARSNTEMFFNCGGVKLYLSLEFV